MRFRKRPLPPRFFGDLTWTCHFCGDERDDADIAVRSVETMIGRVPVTHNRRFCRDREECREAAERWAKQTRQGHG